jgi:hypothetical protein
MSRPAARPIRQRTTACPTCEAAPKRPCWRLGSDNLGRGVAVPAHAARKRLEKLYNELLYLHAEAARREDRPAEAELVRRLERVRAGDAS